jgi:hypothetical protein
MPDVTVLDSFVVELGLDPAKFTDGQSKVYDAMKKTLEQAKKGATETEDATKRILQSISSLKTQAVGAIGAVVGATSLVDFIGNAVSTGANLNRLSRAIGVNAQEISRWKGVAAEFGSTGENMASTFKSMTDAFTAWHVGGPEGPAVMQAIRQINTAAAALDPKNAVEIDDKHGVNGYLVSLAKNLQIIRTLSNDPNMASYLAGQLPNMDSGMIDLLSRGADVLIEKLKEIRGLTNEEAEAAGLIEQRWNRIKTNATDQGVGLVLRMHDLANELFNKPASEAKPWDALFGTGSYAQPVPKTVADVAKTSYGGKFSGVAEREAFIRAEAIKRGHDPDIAVFAARKEGMTSYVGDNGTSFGAFQLHVTPGGRGRAVGDEFQKSTGLDPRDPANERAMITYTLDQLSKTGWSPYHGPTNAGIGNWQGINRNYNGDSNSTSTSVTITGVTINAGPNASASEIADKLRDLGMRRQSENNQSFVGAH